MSLKATSSENLKTEELRLQAGILKRVTEASSTEPMQKLMP